LRIIIVIIIIIMPIPKMIKYDRFELTNHGHDL
jgi:hypothetical protein